MTFCWEFIFCITFLPQLGSRSNLSFFFRKIADRSIYRTQNIFLFHNVFFRVNLYFLHLCSFRSITKTNLWDVRVTRISGSKFTELFYDIKDQVTKILQNWLKNFCGYGPWSVKGQPYFLYFLDRIEKTTDF